MCVKVILRVMAIVAIASIVEGSRAGADFVTLPAPFVADPTKNSQDWTKAVSAAGGQINTDVDFRGMSTGNLDGNFYNTPAHSDGVTLFASDSTIDTIAHNAGPDQSTQFAPISPGEGTAAVANYLLSNSPGVGKGSTLTIKFSSPVMAVGLFTSDYFGSPTRPGRNTLTLSIFSPTGVFLGSADAVRDDFQPDNLYFMGLAESSNVIGSAVFTRGSDADRDTIGIAGIEFASFAGGTSVPEPSALLLAAVPGASCLLVRATRTDRGAVRKA